MIKSANPDPGETIYARQGNLLVGAYKGQARGKPIRMLSSVISARSENGIPVVVQHFNRNMGGVDEADMIMSFYNAGKKTLKVYLNILF
jgi:hypothetical protein